MMHGPTFSIWLACPDGWRAEWRAAWLAERRAGADIHTAAVLAQSMLQDLAGEEPLPWVW